MQDTGADADTFPMPYWSSTGSNEIIWQLITESDEDTRDIVYADIEFHRTALLGYVPIMSHFLVSVNRLWRSKGEDSDESPRNTLSWSELWDMVR